MFGLPSDSYGLVAALFAAAVATFGLLSMAAAGDWGKRHSSDFSAFAVGYLTYVVGFHLLPDSVHEPSDWRWVGIGVMVMLGVFALVTVVSQRGVSQRHLAIGFISILALATHSFFDGVLYEALFHDMSWSEALIAIPGLLLHKFPEGVVAFYLLKEGGLSSRRAVLYAFGASALTTIAGALATRITLGYIEKFDSGPLIGLSAGALLFIVFFDLMPHASHSRDRRGYLYAGIGVAVATAAVVLRTMIGHPDH